MFPGSIRSRKKNGAVASRFNLATAKNWIAEQLGGLFRGSETDQQHRSCEHDVQIGDGRIVRDHSEQRARRIHESENGHDRVDDTKDLKPEPRSSRARHCRKEEDGPDTICTRLCAVLTWK